MSSLSRFFSNMFRRSVDFEDASNTEKTGPGQMKSDSDAGNPNRAWMRRRKYLRISKIEPIDKNEPIRDDCVRFVCVSDTHNRLEQVKDACIPHGDVLLHAGDMTMYGSPDEVHNVNEFLGKLPHKHKIVIAGNHDNSFDAEYVSKSDSSMMGCEDFQSELKSYNVNSVQEMMTNCIYLQDSAVEICGIKIYGAPWTAGYGYWGFQRRRGPKLMEKWNKIPSDTDILITHSPPCGYGDDAAGIAKVFFHNASNHYGCVDLLNTVNSRVKPKYHIFGHIHQGHGMYTDGTTTFVNASICTKNYVPSNSPIVFDFPLPKGHSKNEIIEQLTDQVVEQKFEADTETDDFDQDAYAEPDEEN